MQPEYETILVERPHPDVLQVTLNRPAELVRVSATCAQVRPRVSLWGRLKPSIP